MATNRAKKDGDLGLLTLRDVAQQLRQAPDDLLGLPGFTGLLFDLSGKRKPVRRMDEEDFDVLMVRREELQAWLQGLRYKQPAGAAA